MTVETTAVVAVAQSTSKVAAFLARARTMAGSHPVALGAVATVGVCAAGFGLYKGGKVAVEKYKAKKDVKKTADVGAEPSAEAEPASDK